MARVLTTLAVAGTAALAAVAVPAAAVSARHDGGQQHHTGHADRVTRLTLVETSTGFHSLDVPAPKADGLAGDLGTFESAMSTRGGAARGTLEGSCTQIRADGSLDDCGVTVTLRAGSYRMAGPFDPATGGTLTIVGGTGRYVGAGGTDTIVNQPDGTAVHHVRLVVGAR